MHPYGYFATILYVEPDQSTYEGIEISDRDSGFVKKFENNLSCPIIDHINLMKFLDEQEQGCRWSSSYDHFFMDGNNYREEYISRNDSEDADEWEFVNPFGQLWDFTCISKPEFKSFQDLRKYYKAWKEQNP